MEFEAKGNLGKVDLLIRHLDLKHRESGVVVLSRDEMEEIDSQLTILRNVLHNLNVSKGLLERDQYHGLVDLIESYEGYYKNYGEEVK